jgi:CTP:molybdopterin cytidylyltransferase MocA
MGRPKALLELGGRSWADLALTSLAVGGCDAVLLVIGAHAAEIRAAIGISLDDHAVPNPDWAAGRTGSVQAGIRAAPGADAYVVLPVDHPLVVPEDVAAVVDAWREADPRPSVVRIEHGGRGGHPVLFDAAVAAEVLALEPDAPLRGALRRHDALTVEGSPGVRVNVDTPEEHEKLLRES